MPQKKLTAIDPIAADATYAAEARVLRVLTDGLARIERESDALRIENYLGSAAKKEPVKKGGGKTPRMATASREDMLRERLARHKNTAKQSEETAGVEAAPLAVTEALTLLQAGAQPIRADRTGMIARLADNANVVRAGVMAQQQRVDEVRDEVSAALALRLRDEHRDLVLQQFRAAQSYAAASDELRRFRSGILTAGYVFRADVMPEPVLRSALILGSEADDSEVTRTRRLLEDLKLL